MKGPYKTAIFTDAAAQIGKALILAGALSLVACGGDDDSSAAEPGKDHFLKEKTETIDKAREAEQMMRDAAEKQRKALERQ